MFRNGRGVSLDALAQYSVWVLAWCAFALFCGGLIKGALGVGTPLLTVPMMAFVLPPQVAIAIMALPVVVANIWQFVGAPKEKGIVRDFLPAGLAIAVGSALGTKILVSIDETVLLILVSVLVALFTLLQGSKYRFGINANRLWPAGIAFGFTAGVVGGLSSMFGPMMVLYMVSINWLGLKTDSLLASVSCIYGGHTLEFSAIFSRITRHPVLLFSLIGVFWVSLGMLFGQQLRHRISEARFKVAIRWILFASAASLMARALI